VALGSFPLAAGHYRSATASRGRSAWYSEFGWSWYGLSPPAPIQSLYPQQTIRSEDRPLRDSRGSTSIDFGENQLSPGLIGLSPLPTSHPSGFQPTPVRASSGCYPTFTLLMGRSPWLRVCAHVLSDALVTGLAFAAAPLQSSLASHVSSNSPDHNAKGTQSGASEDESSPRPPTACRRVVSGSLSLPAQGCFSPVPHGTRPLSVTRESSALEGGPPGFAPGSSYRALLRNSTTIESALTYRALTVFGAPFQGTSADVADRIRGSYNPEPARGSVWASHRFARRYSGDLG
jgi:hypothetical protein